MHKRTSVLFVAVFILIANTCLAQMDNLYSFGCVLPFFSIKGTKLGLKLGTYEPNLKELDRLLVELREEAPGSSTMYNIYLKLIESERLSYLLELGYWDNETTIKSLDDAELGATFSYFHINLLYYPDIINDYIPFYIGVGGGAENMRLYGNGLRPLDEVVKQHEDMGLGGSFILGVEYSFNNGINVNINANHIFKRFVVNEDEDMKFSFDGTIISAGVSKRL
ncbi:outer membrane beta-barrel protein [Candidatus Poribacteria bacterium]|nr:outer membrane beta-barrel protein [Candidatus Poribacteria bacterium]